MKKMKPTKILLVLFIHLIVLSITAQNRSISLNVAGGSSSLMRNNAEMNIGKLLNEINRAYIAESPLNFQGIRITDEAVENINSMWNFNTFYCTKSLISESLSKNIKNFELRNIPIDLKDDKGTKSQEIAIEVNESGAITDLYYSLQQFQYKNIMATGNSVIEETRLNIIRNFLENMKTAYMRKDIEFIDNIFSDKALIIVGKKLQKTTKQALTLNTTNKEIMFNNNSTQFGKLTKTQYITNLKKVFKNNRSIKIDFDNIEIVQHQKKGYDSYYGVRLKQDWKSDSYQDQGIVFFVIEFREYENPLIWVRVWQDANTTEKSEQVGLGDIKIKPNSSVNH